MVRPIDLPEFDNPPLTEVVLGVQFEPPQGYQQIYAGDVWKLFKSDFPEVREEQAIPPQFEVFGAPQAPHINFGLVSGAVHDRFLFCSRTGNDLLQFQSDRLLHNWRKVGEGESYPRFECISGDFERECTKLFSYFENTWSSRPTINQCEVSYLNIIPIPRGGRFSDWLRLVNFPEGNPENFILNSGTIIRDPSGHPQGRLTVEANSAVNSDGDFAIFLNLTARGRPGSTDLKAALAFLTHNREIIVRKFAAITTDSAHIAWEKR